MRALLAGEAAPPGRFYDTGGTRLAPPWGAVSVWSASWGSPARLRAVARDAEGWVASAYNTDPTRFRTARAELDAQLRAAGRDPAGFGDLVATTWLHVTEDPAAARRLVDEVLAPLLGRDAGQLAARLPIGSPEHCARVLSDYAQAGAGTVLLWPLRDPLAQLELVAGRVRPLLVT